MTKRTALWILLAVIAIGVAARAYELTGRSLWFDEAFSWRLIQFPFSEMIDRAQADVHPPLYYILLRGWSEVFGTSLAALRSFSVAFAGIAIAVVYGFVAHGWRSRSAGLFAASLTALSGWQIMFAWEARMYTLGIVLALVSSWLILRAMRARGTSLFAWWAAYAVAAAAFAYIHYFAFFTIAAQALFALGLVFVRARGRVGEIVQMPAAWGGAAAAALAAVLYAPWIPTLLTQNQQVQASYWVPELGGWSVPDTFYRMFIPTSGIPPHGWPLLLWTLIPAVATVGIWMWLVIRCGKSSASTAKAGSLAANRDGASTNVCDMAWLTALAGAVPFVLAIVVSLVSQSLYQDRFLAFAQPFLVIAVALAVERIPGAAVRWTARTLLIAGFAVAAGLYWIELDIPNTPGAHGAARYIQEQRQPAQPVLVSSPFIYFSIDYYAQEELGNEWDPKFYTPDTSSVHFAGGPILTPGDFLSPDDFAETDAEVAWVLDTSGFGGSKAQLSEEWELTETQSFEEVFSHQGDIFVRRYRRR